MNGKNEVGVDVRKQEFIKYIFLHNFSNFELHKYQIY